MYKCTKFAYQESLVRGVSRIMFSERRFKYNSNLLNRINIEIYFRNNLKYEISVFYF
jgi:hypothetical protein